METKDISEKIDGVGNIRIVFEPTFYKEKRIPKRDLQEILGKSVVSLRGWSFPHIPREDRDNSKRPYSIANGIEFYICWDKFIELFRLYQSGQFLAKFALYEDTIGELRGNKLEAGKYLDFLSTIYKFTEITLFIRNLLENTDIEGGKLTVEIHKTKNRELEAIFSSNIFSFYADYICRMDKVVAKEDFDREKILRDPLGIARELIKSVFDDFNWKNYSDQMIQTHQENLVGRRL